jgi:hypothetical protein
MLKLPARLLFAVVFILAVIQPFHPAFSETGYMTRSSVFTNYWGGPFGSYVEGGNAVVEEYLRHRPSYNGLEWNSCGSPPASGNWQPYIRWYSPNPTNCFLSAHYVIPQACPVGQYPQYSLPIGTGFNCQDYRPLDCQNTYVSNTVNCIPRPTARRIFRVEPMPAIVQRQRRVPRMQANSPAATKHLIRSSRAPGRNISAKSC